MQPTQDFYNPQLILVAGFYFGTSKASAIISSVLVPVMAFSYLIVALVVIVLHFDAIPNAFSQIFAQAFDFESIFGGFSGSAMVIGIKRGLYSNEAGMGSAPNAAAAAHTTHPAKQGMVQTLSVFIDTLIICSATALMVICSNVENLKEFKGFPLVHTCGRALLRPADTYSRKGGKSLRVENGCSDGYSYHYCFLSPCVQKIGRAHV